jgi:hypothetical protein
MDDTVIALLKRVISDYKKEIKEYLAGGGAEDMASYSRIVGRYEALKLIEGELQEIEKRFIEE